MAANPDHDSVEVLLGELRRDTQIPLELANVQGNHATLFATLRGGDIVPEALVKACHQSPGRARFLKRASTLYVGVFLSQRTLIIGKENVSGVEDCARIANLVTLSLDKHHQILRREQQQQASESLAGHTTALYEQFH
ncbi:MAG: hypothetical protein KDA80_02515, partial [Planctomycetaceae bacterium]|nr:hypothetical protein [Planctomycetaceae bacterium]